MFAADRADHQINLLISLLGLQFCWLSHAGSWYRCRSARAEWRGERSSHYVEVRFSVWDWSIIKKKDVALLITLRRGSWKFRSAGWRGCFDFSGPLVALLQYHSCRSCVGCTFASVLEPKYVIFRWWRWDRHVQKCLTKSADDFDVALFWIYELFCVFLVVSQFLLSIFEEMLLCFGE